jgi:dTDP-4-dehydrorhamnose 3,5-epimerase
MIEGVAVRPLKRLVDERGEVRHMLRRDDPHFSKFGEIYFSVANPGFVKGWHLHKRMTLNYAVVSGRIHFCLYDARDHSKTKGKFEELSLGLDNYALVSVPPGVWNGFEAEGSEPAVVANCADEPHAADEIVREDPFVKHIPHKWRSKAGR